MVLAKAQRASRSRQTGGKVDQFPHHNHMSKTTIRLMNLTVLIYLAYGIISLAIGVLYASWWFIALSIYYLVIWYMEASIVRNITRRLNRQTDLEYSRMRQIGQAILVLDAVLVGVVVLGIVLGRTVKYPGITVHITAIYDIVIVALATYRLLNRPISDSPVMIASKCLNLTLAMTAILSITSALTVRLLDDLLWRRIIVGVVGGVVCLLNLAIARYMIRLADRNLNDK